MEKAIHSLKHISEKLPWGGEVLLLDTGSIITAEDLAMLQALHSRDPKGIMSHLEKLKEKGSGKMMESYYVGYGHKSIGDCATTTIFIEGVSLLAAKAIQDTQLYNGQECSTRYIDFSKQPFLNSNLNVENNIITDKLRRFYLKATPILEEFLKGKYKILENEDDKVYTKAIKARAFDILRGFLPAGATTNLAWTATLRQMADRLQLLRNHPLEEVRIIADKIQKVVSVGNPNSFGHKIYENNESYNTKFMKNYYLSHDKNILDNMTMEWNGIDKYLLLQYKTLIEERPNKTELPKVIGITGSARFSFLLDYGSFRDFQRHRSVIQRMPLLTMDYGFENWYLSELPNDLKEEVISLLKEIEKDVLKFNDIERQYYIPIGYKVAIQYTGDISALTYIAEIRSTKFVHPTLQVKAIQLADILEKEFGIKLYIDKTDVGRFDIKRGSQDISEK